MNRTKCQYCGTDKNTLTYVPGGVFCKKCLDNLRLIRKLKLGIPDIKKGKFRENENFEV